MSTLYFIDDDDNESTSTRDDEEGDSSANILVYCGELVSAVLEMKDSHGRVICHLFKKLPPQSVSIVSIDRFQNSKCAGSQTKDAIELKSCKQI